MGKFINLIVILSIFFSFPANGNENIQQLIQQCENNDAKACAELSTFYYFGEKGLKRDYSKSFKYAKKSCELGYPAGCLLLAIHHYKGKGTDQNTEKAKQLVEKHIKKAKKDCYNGNGFACLLSGAIYQYGYGAIQNSKEAVELYKKGCNLKEKESCLNLGNLYLLEKDLKKSYKKAEDYYKKSCKLKNGRGCTNLGWLYERGYGVEQNYKKAAQFYKKGCDMGDGLGCNNLGWLYRKGYGVEQDYKKAAQFYKKGCEMGNGRGCNNLGWLYRKGYGVEQDYKKAAEFYKKGCDLGDGNGCANLSYLYMYGFKDSKGKIDKDFNKGAFFAKKGCDSNNGLACANLGWLYEKGYGVEQDYKKAIELYKKGCDLGSSRGCTNLGVMYYKGHGVEQNYKKAAEFYKKGCDFGDGNGCTFLGLSYKKGYGVEQDVVKAFLFYKKGCELGNEWGCENAKTLDIPVYKLEQVYPPPKVEITEIPDETNEKTVPITLKITDLGTGIGKIRIFVNNTLYKEIPSIYADTENSRTIKRASNSKVIYKRIKIALPSGKFKIRAEVYDKENLVKRESHTSQVVVNLDKKEYPSFYAIVIGINQFENPDISLKHAVNDAEELAKVLEKITEQGNIYEKVHIKLMTTKEQTSKQRIKKALQEIAKKVKPQDVFLFYIATHGIDGDTYYLLTSDTGFLQPEALKRTAISKEELTNMLLQIKTWKKLVILDACYSGKAVPELFKLASIRSVSNYELAKRLSKAVGTAIIVSTSPEQTASDYYKGHGLFTYVLIEGLKGKADEDKDSFIEVGELASYILGNVKRISEEIGRKQFPVSNTAGEDFYIGKTAGEN